MSTVPSVDPAIGLSGVHKTYGAGRNAVHALRGVELTVPSGDLVALTGRSGAGKTTLLSLLAGFLPADEGAITVAGTDVTAAGDRELLALRRDTVGVIQQELALLPLLTAAENVGVPMRIARTDPDERERRVAHLLERVGLDGHANQRPDEMSGGQQQRVAIARALANQPQVLLADEPTAQLDSETGARVMELLGELVRSDGVTVLVATHDPMIEEMADAVAHLEDGVITDRIGLTGLVGRGAGG